MAPIESLKVSAPTAQEIETYPREFALYKQLQHGKDQISLKVTADATAFPVLLQASSRSRHGNILVPHVGSSRVPQQVRFRRCKL